MGTVPVTPAKTRPAPTKPESADTSAPSTTPKTTRLTVKGRLK